MALCLIDELRTVREPNSDQVVVTAPASEVRRLVLDPIRMVEFGEEIEAISWLGEADAPALGSRFLGRNRNGRRRWETECTVTECAPDRIGYDVHARVGKARIPISHWRYDVEQVEAATSLVTETNWIKAPLWLAPIGALITGAAWRPAANRTHIATTLERGSCGVRAARPTRVDALGASPTEDLLARCSRRWRGLIAVLVQRATPPPSAGA